MRLRTEELSVREIDGVAVLLDLRASVYLRTNRSGAFLLRQLEEPRSREDLVDQLAGRYRLSEEAAGADVDAFLAILDARQLLVDA